MTPLATLVLFAALGVIVKAGHAIVVVVRDGVRR